MQLFFVLQKYNFFQKYQKKNTTFSQNLHGNFTTFPFFVFVFCNLVVLVR